MRIALTLCVLSLPVRASDPNPRAGGEAQVAEIARQMSASLAAQRASVAHQTGASASASFFLLPQPNAAAGRAAAQPRWECDPMSKEAVDQLIEWAASRADVQPQLIYQVVRQESALRPCAVSTKGAMGLMQLMPETAHALGVTDPFDPAQNIDAGARLLRKYLDRYGSIPLALGAYNAGPARVDESGGVPKIPETLDYVRRILSLLPSAKSNGESAARGAPL